MRESGVVCTAVQWEKTACMRVLKIEEEREWPEDEEMFFPLFEQGKKEKYRCWRKFYAKFCQKNIKFLTFFLPLTFCDKSVMICPKFWNFSVPTFWIWRISCSNSLSLAQLCVFCMDDVWESASILSLFLFAFPLRQEAGVEVTGHLSPANSLNGSIFKWGEKKKIRGKWKKYSPILLSRKKEMEEPD